MKYTILINQAGIVAAGLHEYTDYVDWALLEYVSENKHVNYLKLIEDLPITGLKSKSSVSRRISKLHKLGLINKTIYSDADAYEKLCVGKKVEHGCLFCGSVGSMLEKHHYPVRAKNKGTETIDLCVGCHRLFHLMTDTGIYEVSSIVKKIIEGGSL